MALCSVLLFIACSRNSEQQLLRSGNAAYYWKVTFSLDSVERAYLDCHKIQMLYCRYFDVVNQAGKGIVPNATVRFREAVPDGLEIVPTVFIMNNCMQGSEQTVDVLAANIVDRIVQMNETNDVRNVREIQIDCDYTLRNRVLYYHFLQTVRQRAARHGMKLSATIRLHQLSMPAPPVDYGVLMLYNTGDPERFVERRSADGRLLEEGRNPILDVSDVKPYLHYLSDYALPLAAAYPVFVWQRTIHGVDIEHTADYEAIAITKQLVEQERGELRQLIVTYHLDTENINRYTPQHHEHIYQHE